MTQRMETLKAYLNGILIISNSQEERSPIEDAVWRGKAEVADYILFELERIEQEQTRAMLKQVAALAVGINDARGV